MVEATTLSAAPTITRLLERLVVCLGGGSAEDNRSYHDRCALAAQILSCRVEPRLHLDEVHLRHAIQSMLSRWKVSSMPFDELYSRLMQLAILGRKASTLYLLYALANGGDRYSPSASYATPSAMPISPWTTTPSCSRVLPPTPLEPNPQDTSAPLPQSSSSTLLARECEADLVRDVFYIVQAADGDAVKFNPMIAGNIKLAADVPSESINIVRVISQLGVVFQKVQSFTERSASVQSRIRQALTSAIKGQITLYYRLLAVLDSESYGKRLTLRQLFVWIQRPLKCMTALATIADVVDGRVGSSVLSLLEASCRHGDAYVRDLYESLLKGVSRPLIDFMQLWIGTGELHDPFEEFFIEENVDCPQELFWTDQYHLRCDQIPTFLGPHLAQRILCLGKSVGFVRRFGDQPKWTVPGHAQDIAYDDEILFETAIDRAAAKINARLLDVVRRQHQFMLHCETIKKYILMAQGDYVEHLMDLLFHELSQPATTLFRHHLNSLLESAIRTADSSYDQSPELQRLNVRLLQASPGDTGWDVFSLDYRVRDYNHHETPLLVILPPTEMTNYLQIFNFMWRIKRIEHCLSETWKRQSSDSVQLSKLPELSSLIHRGHIIRHEMVQLVQNLNGFIRYDVIEDCWGVFVKSVETAADFDALLVAHSTYVNTLKERLFLGNTQSPLQGPLTQLCTCILQFTYVQTRLHNAALEEVALQKISTVGATQRVSALATQLQSQLDQISALYRAHLTKLIALFQQSDLRFLAFRLDFNEFYGGEPAEPIKYDHEI